MVARITDIFPLLLITLLCVGVVEGGYQILEYIFLQPSVEKTTISKVVTADKDLPSDGQIQKKNDYNVILERNLFGAPPGKGESVASVVSNSTDDLQLTSLNIILMGTINGGKGADRAIILDKSTNKQELYETGDAIQGAIVKEILRGKVILLYNGKDEMLDMSEAANVRSTYAVPAKTSPGVANKQPQYRPSVSPRGTPRRVINRPRAIRPSRSIRKQ